MTMTNYEEILAYLPALQDHASKFCYYGGPADDSYEEYDAVNEEGKSLVMSLECNEMNETIAADLQGIDYPSVLAKASVDLETLNEDTLKGADLDTVCAILLAYIDSLSEGDVMIDALASGMFTKVMEHLQNLVKEKA